MSIEKKQQLTAEQLGILNSEMEKNKKSVGVAYALWFFLGSLGIHKFYLNQTRWGITYIALFILGLITTEIGVGLLILALLGFFLLYDLFTIPKQVRIAYEEEEQQIIDKLLGTETQKGEQA